MSEANTPEIPSDVPWVGSFLKSEDDLQVFRLLTAANELGRPVVASLQVPAEQIAMLRQAFDDTMRDEKYIEFATKRNLGTSPVGGREAQEIITKIFSAPKSVAARAREIVKQ